MMHYASLLLPLVLLLTACTPEDTSPEGRYRRAVAAAMESEATTVDVVLGLELGMKKPAFYDQCTELNRQQLITMGQGSNVIDHPMPNDLNKPATMTVVPIFSKANPPIAEAYELRMFYNDWAPWNASSQADSLLPHVVDYLSRTLQLDPIEMKHPRHGRLYADIQGNRLTAIWADDATMVKTMIVDLSQQKEDPLELLQVSK